jgi:hypothetical protein
MSIKAVCISLRDMQRSESQFWHISDHVQQQRPVSSGADKYARLHCDQNPATNDK